MRRLSLGPICVLAAAWLLAQPVCAADIYLSGNFSIFSGTTGEATGETEFFDIEGEDSDSSPAFGGTIGLAFPMNEAIPVIQEFELPGWIVRGEIEYMTGRDYELRTDGANADDFFNEVDAWTVMPTLSLEVPVREPIEWAFGRIPVLELMSLYGTVGVGVSQVTLDVTDNVSQGSADSLNFAWQGGVGLTYQLTDITTFSFGWRYLSLGTTTADLKFGPGAKAGEYDLDLSSHEFVTGLRLNFYSAPLKDMHPRYWRAPRVPMPGWMPSWLGGPSDEDESEESGADSL